MNRKRRSSRKHRIFRKNPAGYVVLVLCVFLLCFSTAMAQSDKMYTTDGVHVRTEPNSSSAICETVDAGTAVKRIGTSGNWIEVKVDGVTGYIYKDYLSTDPDAFLNSGSSSASSDSSSTTTVNATEVNLRKNPNSHCKIKAVLDKGEEVTVLSHSGNWTKVQRQNGDTGYVYSMYLGSGSGSAKVSRTDAIASYRSDAIDYAMGRLGDTYSQSRRNSPGYADCSSLVRDAFQSAAGVFIGDTTVTQSDKMEDYFYSISKITDAAPGDLVYHLSGDNHVGIYLGSGRVLHASQKSGYVRISTYSNSNSFWEYGCNAAAFCYDNH